MKPIDQYQRFGLEHPIAIRPGVAFHLLLWGGAPLLLAGCVAAMAKGEPLMQLLGLFGLMFFGACFAVLLYALVRAGGRGLLELSKAGVYMSHVGCVLPWSDIGPAWISSARVAGTASTDVVYVLRNVSRHKVHMGVVGRLLLAISKRTSHNKEGGALDWGLAILTAADLNTMFAADFDRETSSLLARLRDAVRGDPDATVFNIPVPMRYGISAEELVGIINREVAVNRGLQ